MHYTGASMSQEFVFIGHCYDPKENHDKIWGYFLRPTPVDPNAASWQRPRKDSGWNACTFWGRRGKAMHFKASVTGWEMQRLTDTKLNKGYKQITEEKLLEIWPTFIEEAEAKLMWEVLAGKVK